MSNPVLELNTAKFVLMPLCDYHTNRVHDRCLLSALMLWW